jgi:hypothetical protein
MQLLFLAPDATSGLRSATPLPATAPRKARWLTPYAQEALLSHNRATSSYLFVIDHHEVHRAGGQ